jgi:3-dehydroquinate synthase II
MRPRLVVDLRDWNEAFQIAALEAGVEEVILPDRHVPDSRGYGVMTTVSRSELPARFTEVRISADRQAEILGLMADPGAPDVLITGDELDVLSLENLVAEDNRFYAQVRSPEEAETALNIMQRGVGGVVLTPRSEVDIREVARLVQAGSACIPLVDAEIIDIRQGGVGYRVFVDTICYMDQTQGTLVGNTTHGYFLVLSESIDNPYTGKRPFRVNAGSVHAYLYQPDDHTEYLSELVIGDPVLVVSNDGSTLATRCGRAKIEKRPMLLIKAQHRDTVISIYLQNAGTVHLCSNGTPVPVTRLAVGDRVKAYIRGVEGRHCGMAVDEDIVEK